MTNEGVLLQKKPCFLLNIFEKELQEEEIIVKEIENLIEYKEDLN